MTGDHDSPTGEVPAGAGGDDYRIEGVPEDSRAVIDALVAGPTVRLWTQELTYLVRGERDGQLHYVGSPGAYVHNLLDAVRDAAAGELTFREALSEFILGWQPWAGEDERVLFNILSLIGSFTPPAGFTKVAGYLTRGDWSGLWAAPHAGAGAKINLQLKALVTLSSYFRAAPVDESSTAFQTYLSILRTHQSRPQFFGFASAQLLALRKLDTADADFIASVQRWPESLREIVPALLSPEQRETAPRDLGRIYNCCRPQGTPACTLFEEVVRERGGVVSRDHQPAFIQGREDDFWEPEPVILLADGSRIEVNLSPEQMVDYVEAREPAALAPQRPELLEEQGKEVASLVRLAESQIIAYVETHLKGGHDIALKPLQEKLMQKRVRVIIDAERNRGYLHLERVNKSFPLKLPDDIFAVLMRIYFTPRHVTAEEFEELLSNANTG